MKLIHKIENAGDNLLVDIVDFVSPFKSWIAIFILAAATVALVVGSLDGIRMIIHG